MIEASSFQSADLASANFDESRLSEVNLSFATLTQSRCVKSVLHKVDFSGSNLRQSDFSFTQVEEVIYADAVVQYVNFHEVKGELDLTELQAKQVYFTDAERVGIDQRLAG